MDLKYKVDGLFPTPIYITGLSREYTKEEIKFVNKCKMDVHKNEGNIITNDTHLLDKPPFKKLKKELLEHLKEYYKVICSYKSVEPYITQSWVNYTEPNQYHHMHEHPNSMVSGVLYIDADPQNDSIKFFNNYYKRIKPEIENWNVFNSESWTYPVRTKDLILFPSSLTHRVDVKKGDNVRISLAFNSFIKGKIGDTQKVSELFIK
jgi:uncharacterized protein (TIGR02466 family)